MNASTQGKATEAPGLSWRLSQLADDDRLHVWIAPDVRSYRQLAEELAFFLQRMRDRLWLFPAWEILPYDRVAPHHTIVGQRFLTLNRLLNTARPKGVLLTALPAWLQRIAPKNIVAAHVWQLKQGTRVDIEALRGRLIEAGMMATDRVLAPGEFAIRGGLIDLWPASETMPLRLDMFDDEIESIRRFDPETQRSGERIPSFQAVPAREVILDETGRATFRAAFRQRFPHLRKHPMLLSAEAGRPHPGIESLLPLVYGKTSRLQDYLPADASILAPDTIDALREQFAGQVREQFSLISSRSDPVISPQELYATETPIHAATLGTQDLRPAPAIDPAQPHPLGALQQKLAQHLRDGWHICLVAHGPGQQERMIEALETLSGEIPRCSDLHEASAHPLASCIGALDAGFMVPSSRLIVLTGRELLGQRLPRKRRGSHLPRADVFSTLAELECGRHVVHEDHGVGRYLGLETITDGEHAADFIKIEYADGAHVFVPVEELGRLHRYTGDEAPKLDRLGSDKWKRTRERARRDLLAMAHELIDIEAARSQVRRPPYLPDTRIHAALEEFSARFPFEETEDQAAAIDAIIADLSRDKPMDRVICGDVGFGKTEVAMRAAFVVASAGKQVAVLAPTTVLANQHYNSFVERFSGCGFNIALISRLQGKKESARIAQELRSGVIRIVIGTHRLLSDQFSFADLGLVIIDEEQRFGVRHKQKLKAFHASVDLLTLTATPIPRTLHQTLAGLRDVSIISTPPAEREAIRTIVATFDPQLANEAIRRELYRGGQVYYLHNHVRSIERIAKRLREDIPEAEIGIAHGQMTPAELDRQMMAFYEGRLHILVCTTIIESGLDVPNANTLIVERADLLGLAQLHQIRGRVGRSHRQAFAYLFTPDPRAMTSDARERLQAIAEHCELGAGFLLARQDMEIRGAGNLLGAEQSGKIEEIGLDLYMEMLNDAVREARGERKPTQYKCELALGINAILPADYIPQQGERLSLYRRIARAMDDAQITMLFEEMTDRFGRMPEEALLCLESARVRWRCQQLAIPAIKRTGLGLRIQFTADSPIEPAAMLARVQAEPQRFRLTPDGQLTLLDPGASARAMLKNCIAFLDTLLEDARP
ncbi:MAG: transcription-repair coupling factor [Zetaproteobacteria bacterium]|nr:MAG: transcription-repair coupling factor [Zetaproteobacteria bacterium]